MSGPDASGGPDGSGGAEASGGPDASGGADASGGPDASGWPDGSGGEAAALALAVARRAVTDAVATLAAAGARTEVLADYEPARRVLGFPRPARLRPVGRVWRLGVLVLDDAGRVYEAGRVVRAERPARRSITANAVAEHRAYRAAAVKGGIAEGETVVFDARPVALDPAALADGALTDPDADVQLRDGVVQVRWSPTQANALVPLDRYLAERADLLAHPPQGA
ncbi:hypothetical protein [Agromyces aerolatus]|uniref:hypothetical protein n=1 Tax=Agromyces sp. LY-1074 TaxID=3074080 RepID=UPI002862ED74|nr:MULTISPECIES: hypothetical protein [unclassified Agromyces]MDR5698760.1 hypothetical protein [Agromyces sp. LY-1074]MDR5705054.1 hypothetical protein [Agromyces sp. LY-1358]